MTIQNDRENFVRYYHNKTKHSLQQYAAGPDTLDWDDQPEAFRWFTGSKQIELPLIPDKVRVKYSDLYQVGSIHPQPLTFENIACLLELSLGLSAWKQYGDAKWALRCNPSSGNLHAEEAYILSNQLENLGSGLYHYLSRDHLLEQRCSYDSDCLPANTLLVGISSIQWREAWKYGERAYRYCQLDTGHAIAALRYAAATLGWKVELFDEIADEELAAILGINRKQDFADAESEHPDLLLTIKSRDHSNEVKLNEILRGSKKGQWSGQANCLSKKHMYGWPIINEVSIAAEKKTGDIAKYSDQGFADPLESTCSLDASVLIRRRRSAQAFDGHTSMSLNAFYRILDMTLPRHNLLPWDCAPSSNINLILFVHRVDDVAPGLYALVRNRSSFESFKEALGREQFLWQAVESCPEHLPLYNLVNANGQNLATTLSCHQGIAGQSCFSVAMVANTCLIDEAGWFYRRLYWEAGMIGQVLYLEAEAADTQGTGIGCYFDDTVHEVLGIKNQIWQSLYHFTVGKGLHDGSIQTIPPYAHLKR